MTEYAPGQMPTNGRYGWYRDHEGTDRQRVSNLIKKVKGDTTHLELWKRRQVAEGLALRDDLVRAVKAIGRPPAAGWDWQTKKKLNELADRAMEAAKAGEIGDGAVTGTATHDLTERVDRGEPIDAVAAGLTAIDATNVRAYDFLVRTNGWEVVEIERTVVNDEVEAAGSFDRVFRIASLTDLLGPWSCQHGHDHGTEPSQVIGDVKSEKDPTLNGLHIGPQLAIYSRCRRMWVPTGGWSTLLDSAGAPVLNSDGEEQQVMNGEYVPAPCVRQDVAVVVHVRDGQAHALLLNLAAGWRAAKRAREQADDERSSARRLGAAGAWFAPLKVVEPKPAQFLVEHAAAKGPADRALTMSYAPAAGAAPLTGAGIMPLPYGAPVPPGGYAVGDTVNVGGIDFTKIAEGPGAAADVAPAGSTHTAMMGNGVRVSEVAVRGTDGMVRWEPAAEVSASPTEDEVQPRPGDPGTPLFRMLIDEIWKATTVDRLGELWTLANEHGVRWSGPVEMAGSSRRRQIECVQRELHRTEGKCACGWVFPMVP